MLKTALLSLLFVASVLGEEEWVSKDKVCSFALPAGWKREEAADKAVEAQFWAPDGVTGVNVTVVPSIKNFHLAKKTVVGGIEKQGGTLLTYEDKGDHGVPTITYAWDLPGTGQFLVIFKYNEANICKWQAFTKGKVAEAADIQAAGKSFHLVK
jgi:hypothetical protein